MAEVRKSYSRKEPSPSALFWTVRKFYSEEESYKRFFARLHKELLKMYKRKVDVDKVVNVLSKGRVALSNLETFFDIKTKRYNAPVKLGDYVNRELARLEKLRELGASEIDATNLFIGVVLQNLKKKEKDLIPLRIEPYICKLVTRTPDGSNPFVINIFDPRTISENIQVCKNRFTLAAYLEVLKETFNLFDKYKELEYNLPQVNVMFPLRKDVRINLIQTIKRSIAIPSTHYGELLTILNRGKSYTDDLELLEQFIRDYQVGRDLSIEVNVDNIMSALRYVKEHNQYSSFSGDNFFKSLSFQNYKDLAETKIIEKENVNIKFMLEEGLSCAFEPVVVSVSYDCTGIENFDEIEEDISVLAHLCLLRKKITYTSSEIASDGVLKITLKNVETLREDFLDKVQKKESSLRSVSNANIRIVVEVEEERAKQASGFEKPKYLRVISDIHADVNRNENYSFNFGDDFVINCGDTAGNATSTLLWVRSNMPRGMFTYGNHLGYDSAFPKLDLDYESNIKEFKAPIHKNNAVPAQVSFLDLKSSSMDGVNGPAFINSELKRAYGIGFVGVVLSTDFKLFGEEKADMCELVASKSMNDFRMRYWIERKDKTVRKYNTEDHKKDFLRSMKKINIGVNTLRREGTPIVVVTHHAPTPYSLDEKYKYDYLSAAFVNDLREYISKHPEIRLWCHGHTHTRFDYIYKNCRIICEPFGYFNENKVNISEYGKRVKLEDIKSDISWEELLKEEIKAGEVKVYKD